MASPYVVKLAKDTGKSIDEIEKFWDRAKQIAAETFGKSEDDFGKKEYDYAYGTVMNMLGKKEAILNPEVFLNSGKSAAEFIEEVISGDFNIGDDHPVVNNNKDEEPEDESKE